VTTTRRATPRAPPSPGCGPRVTGAGRTSKVTNIFRTALENVEEPSDGFSGFDFLRFCLVDYSSGVRRVRGARWRRCGRGRAGVRAAGAAEQRSQGVQGTQPPPRRRCGEERQPGRLPFQQPQLRPVTTHVHHQRSTYCTLHSRIYDAEVYVYPVITPYSKSESLCVAIPCRSPFAYGCI
jgi:hypothetical protein